MTLRLVREKLSDCEKSDKTILNVYQFFAQCNNKVSLKTHESNDRLRDDIYYCNKLSRQRGFGVVHSSFTKCPRSAPHIICLCNEIGQEYYYIANSTIFEKQCENGNSSTFASASSSMNHLSTSNSTALAYMEPAKMLSMLISTFLDTIQVQGMSCASCNTVF